MLCTLGLLGCSSQLAIQYKRSNRQAQVIWLRMTADLFRDIQPLMKAVVETKELLAMLKPRPLSSLCIGEMEYKHLTKHFRNMGYHFWALIPYPWTILPQPRWLHLADDLLSVRLISVQDRVFLFRERFPLPFAVRIEEKELNII